jgi:hypothetical protein
MIVIIHETVGVAYPIVASIHLLKSIKQFTKVLVVFKDGPSCVTAGGYMIHCSIIFYTQWSYHDGIIADLFTYVNIQDLTPYFAYFRSFATMRVVQ